MNAFFESLRDDSNQLAVYRGDKRDFPLHFHSSIEIVFVLSGNFDVVCNGVEYSLSPGSIAFFDSYDVHGYMREGKNMEEEYVLIVPTKYFSSYKEKVGKKRAYSPVINDLNLCVRCTSLVKEYLMANSSENVKQSAAELILFLLSEKLKFYETYSRTETDGIREILKFVNEHFREDITLKVIAKNVGYSCEHVSRIFNKYVRKSVPLYINKLRVEYVEKHLKEKKITTLIFDAGFNSVQSYYRNKKALMEK